MNKKLHNLIIILNIKVVMKNLKVYLLVLMVCLVMDSFAQIKVTQSGTVGIGTLTPQEKFHVVGNSVFTSNIQSITSAAYIRGNNNYSSATTPDFTWYNNDQTGIFHPAYNTIAFSTYGTEKMRIDNRGYVGINNNNPLYRLDLQGSMRFNDWTDVYLRWTGDHGSAVLYPERDWYLQLGFNNLRIGNSFHHVIHTYNLYEDGASENSKELNLIEDPISKLKSINGIYYYLNDSIYSNLPESIQQIYKKERFGLNIDEVESVFPQLIYKDDSTGIKYINYTRFIPVIIEVLKSQQLEIEYLTSLIKSPPASKSGENLKEEFDNAHTLHDNSLNKPLLYQNVPNPFNQKTIIRYYLPDDFDNAAIFICNLEGSLILTYNLNIIGNGEIEIQANQLQPGFYLYTLLVNGVEYSTKRMLLTF
jgi:hypothetical protein